MTGPETMRRRVIRKVGNWPRGSLLGGLSEGTRGAMTALGRPRQFTAGETMIIEGDRSTTVFLLLDACVKVTANTESGKVALLGIRVGGDLVGEFAALDGRPRAATVTAAGPCLVRVISQENFLAFLEAHPEAALAVSRAVVGKVRWTTRRRVEYGNFSTTTRLARVIVELARSYGEPVREGVMIGVALTQPELAALVGAADPTIHKALTALRRQGVLGTGYRRIIVHDIDRLQAFAGLHEENPEPGDRDETVFGRFAGRSAAAVADGRLGVRDVPGTGRPSLSRMVRSSRFPAREPSVRLNGMHNIDQY